MDVAQTAPIIPQAPKVHAKPANTLGPDKAQEAAREFESFFIFQMLEHMSEGIESPDVYGGGSAENMFRSMVNEKMAAEVSENSNLGIAEAVEQQIKRYQEVNER